MRLFLTRWFARFARREAISRKDLVDLLARAEAGIVDADLGSGLCKLRLARPGRGRSGGYRVVVVLRRDSMAFALYAYAKNAKADLEPKELAEYKKAAADFMGLTETQIERLVAEKKLTEIAADGQTSEE